MKYLYLILAFAISTLMISCASGPKKDLFIKMRPPTSEIPHFQKDGGFGARFDLESRRVIINPTSNLITNFNFDNNSIYEGSKNAAIAGFDFSATYTRPAFGIPIEYELSTDFAHIKFQLLDMRTSNTGLYVTGNFGMYNSSVCSDSGDCKSICLSSESGKNMTIENATNVKATGRERKWGLSAGYYISPTKAFFLAHNLYENVVSMSANRTTGTPLEIDSNESVQGKSFGAGYLFEVDERSTLAIIVDSIDLSWRDQKLATTNIGLHMYVHF